MSFLMQHHARTSAQMRHHNVRCHVLFAAISDTTDVFAIDPVTAVLTLKEASTLTGGQLLSVLVKVRVTLNLPIFCFSIIFQSSD